MVSTLAIYDFDGTLYKGDSMRDFARFIHRSRYRKALLRIALPYLLARLGLGTVDRVKRRFMQRCFAGYTAGELCAAGNRFFEQYRHRLYPSACLQIEHDRSEGVRCVIVSASCAEWLQPFCTVLQTELICTRLEYGTDGRATGHWVEPQVKGAGKLTAIRRHIDLSQYTYVTAYGNTSGDKVLASIAQTYKHCYFSD